jgi:Domain of unknown function (DUF4340)
MNSLLKPRVSTILVIFFFFILLFLGLFAEVFESQSPEVDMAQIYANPVPIAQLQKLSSLRLTNKQGSFLFENTDPQGTPSGPWQMTEPQALKVKSDVISRIVETLSVIRVRNFHRLEPINISSFSLDNPTLTLNFTNSAQKIIEIKVGLINPIDNSAYLSVSGQNQIYQIDPLEIALESYELAQLVESKVLALNPATLQSLEIYSPAGLELKLLKKDEQWVDQAGNTLKTARVEKFFADLEDLKSFSIMENMTPEQKDFMEKVMAAPAITLKIISGQNVRNYLIGEIKGAIPGVLTTKGPVFALTTEDKKSYVLLEKDELKILNLKPNDLK